MKLKCPWCNGKLIRDSTIFSEVQATYYCDSEDEGCPIDYVTITYEFEILMDIMENMK